MIKAYGFETDGRTVIIAWAEEAQEEGRYLWLENHGGQWTCRAMN